MKKFFVSVILLSGLLIGVPAFAYTTEPYNPVKALREGQSDIEDSEAVRGIPPKKRDDHLGLIIAPEYFFDFGSDLPDADGWGLSIAGTVIFESDLPKWDFIGELEFLAFTAESGHYMSRGSEVKETLQSANILANIGLARTFYEKITFEALVGIGFGGTYGEIKGENFKKSTHGNWTTTLSLKTRCEYAVSEHVGIFAGYRFAYISPSIASKIADWHNLDLFSQSVELGVHLRF